MNYLDKFRVLFPIILSWNTRIIEHRKGIKMVMFKLSIIRACPDFHWQIVESYDVYLYWCGDKFCHFWIPAWTSSWGKKWPNYRQRQIFLVIWVGWVVKGSSSLRTIRGFLETWELVMEIWGPWNIHENP